MLSQEVDDLLREWRVAREDAEQHRTSMETVVSKYHGPYWRAKSGFGDADEGPALEGAYFEYISLLVPRLVFDNPRVQVKSRRAGQRAEAAEAMEHGLNRWVRDAKFRALLSELATEFCTGYGVGYVRERPFYDRGREEGDEGASESRRTWPVADRISPHRYFQDPKATREQDLRFRGHEVERQKDDLIEHAKRHPDEGWDITAIESLTEDLEWDQASGRVKETQRGSPERGLVQYVAMWVPGLNVDGESEQDGFNGSMFYFGLHGEGGDKIKARFIREPHSYFGPKTGPYTLFSAYYVPDSAWGLSPLIATAANIEDLNAQAMAQSESMRRHKRFIGVPDANTAARVVDAYHDEAVVVPFEDGKGQIAPIEVGGSTEQQAFYIEMARHRLDKVLGVDDAQRGSASGKGTATEHAIANESAATRIAHLKQRFTDCVVDMLYGVAHWLWYSESVVIALGEDEEVATGTPEPVFRGGPEDDMTLDDMEFEIEPYSMERASEGLRSKQVMEAYQLKTQALQLAQMFPKFPWRDELNALGDAMNFPGLGDAFTPEVLASLSQGPMGGVSGTEPKGTPLLQSQGPKLSLNAPSIGKMTGGAATTKV